MTGRLKYWFIAAALGTLPLIVLGFLWRPTAAAGLWYVAPGGDDANDCQTTVTPCATINAAIGKAAPGDTIDVATGTYTESSGAQVVWITQSVTLLGGWDSGFASQNGLSTVDGEAARAGLTTKQGVTVTVDRFIVQNGLGGILNGGVLTVNNSSVRNNVTAFGGGISNSGTLTVNNITISKNTADKGGGLSNSGIATVNNSLIYSNTARVWGGGGIDDSSYSTLTLNNSAVIDNATIGGAQNGPSGGGISSSGFGGIVTLNNSTVSGNSASFLGGGIFNYGDHVKLNSSTISANSAASGAGGVFNDSGQNGEAIVTAQNSIVYGNTGGACPDIVSIGSLGYNLIGATTGCGFTSASGDIIGVDPILGPLEGSPGYHRLLEGSPAINAGNPGGCSGSNGLLATDQRAYPRLGRCDIGAYEVQPLDFSEKIANQKTSLPGQPLRYTVNLNNGGGSNIGNVTVVDTLPAGTNYVTGTLYASSGIALYQTGVISWTGSVSAGASVAIQYYAASLPNASLGTVFTNTALISGDGELFSRRAVTTLALAKLYLPLISKPLPGIQGFITFNGAPASGTFVELRRFDGQSYSTQANTTTDGSGFYNFTGAPSLPPGQFYYVRYLNTGGVLGYLSFWGTAKITSFTAGSAFGAGSFDLADVQLAAPNPGATVALPALFQWVRRPATTSDSYQLSLFDPNGNAFGQTGLLGYVNGLTLTGVPSSFHSGTPYGWYVAINSPDGGYGESYYYRRITFSNILAGSQPAVAGGTVLAPATAPVDRPRP